ncbi:MAG TPA: aminoglycoside phosphotransferase family protein [Mycobacteriales bacterium]|nr:aminoglycoside phosphotransferase family protein [Mycobacteriales bacterium]
MRDLIPDGLRQKAAILPGGAEWLADLPAICRRLSVEWSVELGTTLDGCHISLVIAADRAGEPFVLKVPLPSAIELGTLPAGARADEAAALRVWAGDGAVRLVEFDAATEAMLQERCVPGTTLDRHDHPDEIAAELLTRLHRTPATGRFERLAVRADALARDLPARFERAGAPFDHWLLDSAVESLKSLTGGPEVLLHGDFHLHNILAAEREPWLAIDPLPMIGDPAYDAVQYLLFRKGDLADPVRDWKEVMDRFCRRIDVDAERVRAWTFARLVTDALASYGEGLPVTEMEAYQGDLWTARLVHRLRE